MAIGYLEIGGVYKTELDARPWRIIGLDEYEVFYDCQWSDGKWTFAGNYRKKSIFYRMARKTFQLKSTFIARQDLNEEEWRNFRPDLPMRFGRYKDLSWKGLDQLPLRFDLLETDFRINSEKLALVPQTKKGGLAKSVVLDEVKALNAAEFLKRASEIQNAVYAWESEGIGFYRLGFEKGSPRYGIGEYFDKAGILKS